MEGQGTRTLAVGAYTKYMSTEQNVEGVRVLVVAGDPLTRAGLTALLSGQPGCVVVGQLPPDVHLVSESEAYLPDVVLFDVGWDSSEAPDRLSELRDAGLPVMAVVTDEEHAAQAWAAGARGLLFRDAELPVLVAALQAVGQGLSVFPREMAPGSPRWPQDGGAARRSGPLTPRELEVLGLLAEGLSNKAMAHRLDVSEHTVKFHLNAILGKLGAQSRTEAVVLATRLGLVSL